jgi:hypothetical protein
MDAFSKGQYHCRGNYLAIVAQTKTIKKQWVLRGAIRKPGSNVYVLAYWSVYGHAVGLFAEEFDLIRKKEESPTK